MSDPSETKKLYKLINRYKEQITQLELRNVSLEIALEEMQEAKSQAERDEPMLPLASNGKDKENGLHN